MPEDSKKSHDKKKGDPKEQRRPRQRHQPSGAEKKADKKTDEPKNVPKVTVPQKPVYESPPPEFYKSLKRETDEILKITEEENTKYKKKEIQSNWAKYEMPIDSYEEIEEHENLGADYEKLIQAPLSIGGHFQFKHEKSWDINTGPSLYDKYFEINMEELNVALCSIPFYERNSIDESNFSQTDILTMNNRSTRFKQKYYNDKSYSTPETEAHDKILNNLRESMKDDNVEAEKDTNDIVLKYDNNRKTIAEGDNTPDATADNDFEFKTKTETEPNNVDIFPKHEVLIDEMNKKEPPLTPNIEHEHDDFAFEDTNNIITETSEEVSNNQSPTEKPVCHIENNLVIDKEMPMVETKVSPVIPKVDTMPTKVVTTPAETKKNPVIESPEDLEKWLDDFLDG